MFKEVERIECVDPTGTRFVVVKRQRQLNFTPLSGPREHVGGLVDFILPNGFSVNSNDDETEFEVLQTGVTLRRV